MESKIYREQAQPHETGDGFGHRYWILNAKTFTRYLTPTEVSLLLDLGCEVVDIEELTFGEV